MKSRRKVTTVLLTVVLVLLGTGVAHASWNATGSGSGVGKAGALSVPNLNATSGQTSSAATINWSAPGGQQNSATYTATATASGHTTKSCNALASAGSCSMSGLDASTSYTVAVKATLSTNWTSSTALTTAVTTAVQSVTIGTIGVNGNSGTGSIPGTATGGTTVSILICKGSNTTSCTGTQIADSGTATVTGGNWTYAYTLTKNLSYTVIATLGAASANKSWST